MSDALASFLSAIEKLPRFDGITFRGLADGAPEPDPISIVTGVVATSRSPRVASENFAAPRLLALLNRTGRGISAFSAHPEEREVVVRPATVWRRLADLAVPGIAAPLLVLEELDLTRTSPQPTEWGDTLAELTSRLTRVVQTDVGMAGLTVTSPGKFLGPWFAQPYERP